MTESNYWGRTLRHRMSRRGVLRGAGIAGAGLAGAALIGCGDDDDDDDDGGAGTPRADGDRRRWHGYTGADGD